MALWNLDISDCLELARLKRWMKLKAWIGISYRTCADCGYPFGDFQSIWEPYEDDRRRIVHRYCYGYKKEWGEYPADRWPRKVEYVNGQEHEYRLDSSWKHITKPEP